MKKNLLLFLVLFFLNINVVSAKVVEVGKMTAEEKIACQNSADIKHYVTDKNGGRGNQLKKHDISLYVCHDQDLYMFVFNEKTGNGGKKTDDSKILYMKKDKLIANEFIGNKDFSVLLSQKFINKVLETNPRDYQGTSVGFHVKRSGSKYAFGATEKDFDTTKTSGFKTFEAPRAKTNGHESVKDVDDRDNEPKSSNDVKPLTEAEMFELLPPELTDCVSLLGYKTNSNDPAYYINMAFNILKYLAILFLVVFSMADYFKAVVSKDEDALSKATRNTIKRFIYCIIIFVLPTLILYIFELSGVMTNPKLCGIQ